MGKTVLIVITVICTLLVVGGIYTVYASVVGHRIIQRSHEEFPTFLVPATRPTLIEGTEQSGPMAFTWFEPKTVEQQRVLLVQVQGAGWVMITSSEERDGMSLSFQARNGARVSVFQVSDGAPMLMITPPNSDETLSDFDMDGVYDSRK